MTIELALEWASQGQRVLPVNGQTKRPLIKAWQDACTTDVEVIRAWWSRYPMARVGMATGEPGYDVLDFDVADGKPGLAQLERLIDAGILVPGTFRVVATPSGGRHLWLRGTDQRNKQNDKAVPGVDFRGVGGMVLVPGNPGYRWVTGRDTLSDDLKTVDWETVVACLVESRPADQPSRVLVSPGAPKQPAAPVQPARASSRLVAPLSPSNDAPGEESPLDWFCNQNDIGELLRRDGWTFAYEHGGRTYWVRPGKDQKDGISANIMLNPDGRQTLMNFSTSVDLPTDRGLSAAQYWAYTRHGGDMRAAASTIRRTMMPARPRTTQTATGGMTPPPGAPVASETPRSGEVIPSGEAGTPEPIRQFWEARPELREVYWQARVGDSSPWAVLGSVLAEIAGRVGPHVRLPALGGVGAAASLNILVAISGNSGEGKGRSSSIARGLMGSPRPPHRKPGTGQGIAAMFTEQTKEGPVQSNDTVVLNVAEITQLGAHMNQQGATITSTLLEVYMGEELGEHYANKELRRPVRDGAYRLALVAGVQPDNASIIFDHAASGLPQRFIWLPAFWPDSVLPESGIVPPAPGHEQPRWRAWSEVLPGTLDDSLDATGWSPTDAANGLSSPQGGKKKAEPEALPAPVKDEQLVTYAPGVGRVIATDHRRRLNAIKKRLAAGEETAGDPDAHLLLTRIKVAALLAVWLDHTTHISEQMWELAGLVIWVSNTTRHAASSRLAKKAAERNVARVSAQIAQRAMIDEDAERKHNAVYLKACDRLTHLLTAAGDWTSMQQLNRKLSSVEKKRMREAGIDPVDLLSDLEQAGKVTIREPEGAEQGVRYRAK